ncbi:F-box/WD repeat-containing protein 9-like isoform X2 [Temnothorax nylanderi]|uniref:F-box/WD repeat-containing protein 9-like isoform X2 n=1 Tax=Temnothorax nylanderi TaxID=102681 RepID=UPI003A850E9B
MCTIVTVVSSCGERPDKLFWKLSCVAIAKQTALFEKPQNSMEKLLIEFPLPLARDAATSVLLMPVDGITYLVGTKDHSLFYKKLSYREEPFYEDVNIKYLKYATLGCLTAIDHTIYNGCSDNTVKSWVLTNTGLVHDRTYEIKCNEFNKLRDVSSCPERAFFATGTSLGTIYVFDSRSSNKPIYQYRPHTEYMTKLAMNTEYILSASRDKTVSVWDQRAGRTIKSITIPDKAIPMYINMRRDLVCVGDNKKKLHMLDPKNDFELVKSYSTKHTGHITGVRLTHGCLITSSWDGTVRISSPTDPPKPITTLRSSMKYIRRMDYLNDTLAIAGPSVVVWRPRNRRV